MWITFCLDNVNLVRVKWILFLFFCVAVISSKHVKIKFFLQIVLYIYQMYSQRIYKWDMYASNKLGIKNIIQVRISEPIKIEMHMKPAVFKFWDASFTRIKNWTEEENLLKKTSAVSPEFLQIILISV